MKRTITALMYHAAQRAHLLFFIAAIFFLPTLFVCLNTYYKSLVHVSPLFKLGLENITQESLTYFMKAHGQFHTVGLITNHTGKDQQGKRNIDILREKNIPVMCIFTPKHGFKANQKNNHATPTADPTTHIPIVSWQHPCVDHSPCNTYLQKVDMLVFDMQDSGMRYGHTATLREALEVAARYNKKVIVLDRPNLLGTTMEGVLSSLATSCMPIPSRHGMTSGELAHYFNTHVLVHAADLVVIPMRNYERLALSTDFKENLSPNLHTIAACYGYSFLGLLGEIAPFDVGLGTAQAFQCLTLPASFSFPKKKWYELRVILKKFGIDSRMCSYVSPRKKQQCVGLSCTIRDINSLPSFAASLAIIKFFKDEGLALTFSPSFDEIIGSTAVRKFLEGNLHYADLGLEINQGLRNFFHKASHVFMYTPLPHIAHI